MAFLWKLPAASQIVAHNKYAQDSCFFAVAKKFYYNCIERIEIVAVSSGLDGRTLFDAVETDGRWSEGLCLGLGLFR